jgi:uncharacterized membrane protein YqjE
LTFAVLILTLLATTFVTLARLILAVVRVAGIGARCIALFLLVGATFALPRLILVALSALLIGVVTHVSSPVW